MLLINSVVQEIGDHWLAHWSCVVTIDARLALADYGWQALALINSIRQEQEKGAQFTTNFNAVNWRRSEWQNAKK